jgi:hypothetical protein
MSKWKGQFEDTKIPDSNTIPKMCWLITKDYTFPVVALNKPTFYD